MSNLDQPLVKKDETANSINESLYNDKIIAIAKCIAGPCRLGYQPKRFTIEQLREAIWSMIPEEEKLELIYIQQEKFIAIFYE